VGLDTEALSGDLLEEFHCGHTEHWLWGQVLSAIAVSLWQALCRFVPAILFSAGWSMLYAQWRKVGFRWLLDSPHANARLLSWPGSALLELSWGVLPALAYVWLGVLIYLSWRREPLRIATSLSLFQGLSFSSGVLLLATIGLLHRVGHPVPDLRDVMRPDFYLVLHLYRISIPIALSVFVALFLVNSGGPRVARRKSSRQPGQQRKFSRLGEAFGLALVLAVRCHAQASVPPPPPLHGTDAELIAALQQKLDAQSAAGAFSGDVFLARDGRPIFEHAYGLANRERNIPNSLVTRFRVASVGKMFTAVAVLQLVEQGKLRLDEHVGTYLPDYPNKDLASKVTVSELLDDTGGTGDIFTREDPFGRDFQQQRATLHTVDDYLRQFGNRALQFTPGARYEYSNNGFILLGAIIECVSGESYYEYVQQHIFKPAGMTATGFEPEGSDVPNLSIGYTRYGGTEWRANTETLTWRGLPCGGGYSTVGDLLRFADALRSHQLLSVEDTKLMMTGKVDLPGDGRYAYGFIDHTSAGVNCRGHGGTYPGENADFEMCIDSRYAYAVLANMDPPAAAQIGIFIGSWLTASHPEP
jgi:CubicO group peptidase (beta-lactamase class C family)